MSSQNQMSNDFYDFSYSNLNKNDDDELTIAFLMTLLSFYDKYMAKSPKYILEHIDEDIKKLQSNLLSDLSKYDIQQRINEIQEKINYYEKIEYNSTETDDVTKSTIQAIVSQLKQDITTKALVWIDLSQDIQEFNIKANYERAITRLRDTASYYDKITYQKIQRELYLKKNGSSQKYKWVCYGKRPCAWCIDQAKIPPRIIEEIPFDHINGECGIEPVNDDNL